MTHHLPHLLMLVLPMTCFVVLFAVEWRRTSPVPLGAGLGLSAVASAGASVVHAVVVPHHLHQAAVLGWFFAVLSVAQLAWVVWLLLVPGRRVVVAGVLGNLGVIALWAWTRAVGVPLGIDGGARQRVGVLDVTSTLLEVGAVACGLAWLYARSAPRVAVSRRAAVATPAVRRAA